MRVTSDRPLASGGRPPGEVRQVMLKALRAEEAPLPLRAWAERTQVGYATARATVSNLVRGGLVEIVGQEKQAHCTKWVKLYDIKAPAAEGDDSRQGHGWVDLARCVQGWAR